MRAIKNTSIIVLARTMSGLAGYVVLAMAANKLLPSQFAELAFFQTIIFLLQITFDSGVVSVSNREVSGLRDWYTVAMNGQGVRMTIHLILAISVAILAVTNVIHADDKFLPYACVAVLLSNPLNSDWILISLQEQVLWAKKIILSGFVNIVFTSYLLCTWKQPSAVLVGVALINLISAIYLKQAKGIGVARPVVPSMQQASEAAQLSVGSVVGHTGYNYSILIATSIVGGLGAAAYAALYRLFSASTIFIAPVTEFIVANEIAHLKNDTYVSYSKNTYIKLLASSLLLVSPFVVMPPNWLYVLIDKVIDLNKYGISTSDLWYVKIALVLYCADFCAQRTAYIYDHKRIIVGSAVVALVVSGVVMSKMLISDVNIGLTQWFYPVFAYQVTSIAITVGALYLHRDLLRGRSD